MRNVCTVVILQTDSLMELLCLSHWTWNREGKAVCCLRGLKKMIAKRVYRKIARPSQKWLIFPITLLPILSRRFRSMGLEPAVYLEIMSLYKGMRAWVNISAPRSKRAARVIDIMRNNKASVSLCEPSVSTKTHCYPIQLSQSVKEDITTLAQPFETLTMISLDFNSRTNAWFFTVAPSMLKELYKLLSSYMWV